MGDQEAANFGGKRTLAEGGREAKTVILGMKKRGGRVETKIIPNVRKVTLRGVVLDHVEKGSTVSTDELSSYNLLTGEGYIHGAVDHSRKEWAWTGN